MNKSIVVTADFDGTLFDPNWKLLTAVWYNARTSRLLSQYKIPFILNTGRPHWDSFANVQIATIGMKKPDVVIYAAGACILWNKNGQFHIDQNWDALIQKVNWDKAQVIQEITPIIKKIGAALFDTHNKYMTRIWVHKMPVTQVENFIKALRKKLINTNILRTEQILLPNTENVFSGYLLLIPSSAGKKEAMNYVLKKLGSKENLVFGDALVDVSMLQNTASQGFALNPTPLARKELRGSRVTILEGSPPANILKVLKNYVGVTNSHNSPYRAVSESILKTIEPLVYPSLTPDQLSMKGLDLIQSANPHRIGDISKVMLGFLLDLFDGLRSRRRPELRSKDGQLVDVYADRMKEFLILKSHNQIESALSCFLPSIARSQVEAMGKTVEELDSAGGSALSRSIKIIRSFILFAFGNRDGSNRVDNSIYLSNIQTFKNRKSQTNLFSWNKIKDYERKSVTRLLFLVNLLQNEAKKQKINNSELQSTLNDYLSIEVNGLKKHLKITFPKF